MRGFLFSVPFVLMLSVCACADDAIQGDYVGDWSGASGSSGTFKISVTADNGKPKCTVSFNYSGEEVKTNVTLCKSDGPKIEAQYDFDLGGYHLQSTIHGEQKGSTLEGKYETKTMADGSPVDEGDWKASRTQ